MPQPAIIQDAGPGEVVKLGSPVLVFANAGSLIAEDFQFDKGSRGIDFYDANGSTIKAAYSTAKLTGSAVIQFHSATSGVLNGDSFNYAGFIWIVTSIGQVFTQNGAAKCKVEFAEKMSVSPFAQPNIFDGEFYAGGSNNNDQVTPVGNFIWSHPLPYATGALVLKMKFVQNITGWSAQAIGTGFPGNPALVLVEESPLEETGVAGLVTWWRTWATKPSSYNIPIHVTKNYQLAQYVWNNLNQVTNIGLISWTALIKATMRHDYYLDQSQVPALPVLPVLMLIPYFGNAQLLTDAGTGFPTQGYPFGTGYSGNGAPSYISGTIEPYLGKMMCVKTITG